MDNRNSIWCNIEIGMLNQTIHCPGGETVRVPLDYLGATLANTCYEYSLNDVYIFGPMEFIKGIRNEILEAEQNMFSNQNIKVHFEGEI